MHYCPQCGTSLKAPTFTVRDTMESIRAKPKPARKLSAWQKFVKANSKKKIYKFANGKLKLKKMGIAYRKTPAGRKK
jgi:hypothetical protein